MGHPPITARLYGGERAVVEDVRIDLNDPKALRLEILTTGAMQRWPFERLDIVDKLRPPAPGRIAHLDQDGARLEISDPDDWSILMQLMRNNIYYKKSHKRRLSDRSYFALVCMALILGLVLLAMPVWRLIDEPLYHIADKGLGQVAYHEYVAKETVCDTKESKDVIQQLVTRLDETIAEDLRVYIVDSPEDNAFALPDNQIIILSGLIHEAESSDEVAGVLAHEMGHIAKQHATKGFLRSYGLLTLIEVLSSGSGLSSIAVLGSFKFSRDDEREADLLGLEMLKNAGISSKGFSSFFARHVDDKDGSEKSFYDNFEQFLSYVSTHPDMEERLKQINAFDETTSYQTKPALNKEQWNILKDACTDE